MQKHEPCSSIDYDLEHGLLFQSSDDEEDGGGCQELPMNDPGFAELDRGEPKNNPRHQLHL